MTSPARDLCFETIHREFHPKVLRYLAGFAGIEEAADLAQVVMLKVSEHLPAFRGECSLATWIYRIATNVALDRLRQREPERVSIDFHQEEDEAGDASTPAVLRAPSAEACAARREMNACVREFLDMLPTHYGAVLILSDIEGLRDHEIAAATGLSLATVKTRLHRARAGLRDKMRAGCTLHRDDRNELACERRAAFA